MIYIESNNFDPAFNLALEQYIFDYLDPKQNYFMFWQNKNTIVVGKNQNTVREINTDFVKENDIKVVRRLSGGGAVYHDLGNLNFTYIISNEYNMADFDFKFFYQPVIKALAYFGISAEANGRNDIVIDGKKFSGNAQYAKKGRIMHHGTLMYDSDLHVLANALRVSKDKIKSKGIKSVHSRVTNIKDYMSDDIPLQQFKEILLEQMFLNEPLKTYHLTTQDIEKIIQIKEEKYDTWEWNYGRSPGYSIVKERRIEGCGSIELHMDIQNGIIQGIHIYGDYFGNKDITELCNCLIGIPLKLQDIKSVLDKVPISDYINKLSQNDFIDIMLS